MTDRAEPTSPDQGASSGAENKAFDLHEDGGGGPDALDMGLDTDDGLSAELGALVAKVASGFNAEDTANGTAAGRDAAPRANGGGVQPQAIPTEPDPGPPYDDTITADVLLDVEATDDTADNAAAGMTDRFSAPHVASHQVPADELDASANGAPPAEEESEWLFVDVDGDDDPESGEPVASPKVRENSFRATPKASAVDFEDGKRDANSENHARHDDPAPVDTAPSAGFADPEAENGPVDVPMALSDLIEPKAAPETRRGRDGAAASIPLEIDVEPSDPDSSDVLTVSISGLPKGCTLSAGRAEPDGRWHLEAAGLPGLQVKVPTDGSKKFEIEITATETDPETGESSSVSEMMTVDAAGGHSDAAGPVGGHDMAEHSGLAGPAAPEAEYLFPEDAPGPARPAAGPVADLDVAGAGPGEAGSAPNVDAGPAPIAFALDGALMDTDGSERLTLLVTGLPEGATLTGGKRGPKGTWLLTPNDVEELGIELLPDFAHDFTLRVQVIATERGDPRVSTVLADMHVRVDHCGGGWRLTSVNSRTDDGNVAFEPGVPGRVTVTSEVTAAAGGTGADAACFLSLPQGYRVSWISPGVEADDRWSPGAGGTGGVLDLTDFVTADGRLHWTFGIEASMRAEPAASADFPVSAEPPVFGDDDFEVTDPDANGFDGGAGEMPAAVPEVLRGGGGEDRRSGEAGPTRQTGADSPAEPEPKAEIPAGTPAEDNADVTAELALSQGTVLDSDADSVTLSADAVGAIRLRDGVLRIKGVRAIEW